MNTRELIYKGNPRKGVMMNSNRLGKYTHIRSVCEECAVGVNLVQKQVMAGTPVRWKELVLQY